MCTLSLSAACGSRLTDEQHELLSRGYTGQGPGVVDATAGPGTGDGGLPSAAPGSAAPTAGPTTGSGNSGNGGNGGNRPGPQPTGTTGGSPACAVAGGRGGATDVGVTAEQLTVANIADVSGPIPGLFESARQATTAFFAYWNATYGGICGRRVKVVNYDSRTDANGHREATLAACESSFAIVGAMSAFDSGGAKAAEECGIADVPAAAVTPEHKKSRVTYAAETANVGIISSTLPLYIKQRFPDAIGKAGYIYIDAGASSVNAEGNIRAYHKFGQGWKFIYTAGIDVSTFNYAPYVQQMKEKGVRFVQFLGAYQQAAKLAKAMHDQGFKPDMFLLDPTGYNVDYVKQGGSAVEGTYVYTDAHMFEEQASNPEMTLYLRWLRQVAPNATPSYFGMFAWSAARLFATEAAKVGPQLTRAKVVARLGQVGLWTGNGLHSPQQIGKRLTSECFGFLHLVKGQWRRVHPSNGQAFACNPLVYG